MISNNKLLELYNYLKGKYVPNADNKKSNETFRSLTTNEVNKYYSSKPVSYNDLTDYLIGLSLSKMVESKEEYNTLHIDYYFSYSFMRYDTGKKPTIEKLTYFTDKLSEYNINKFVIDYRSLCDSSLRKLNTSLEVFYDLGYKLLDIDRGYYLFNKEE